MAAQPYYPGREGDQLLWLQNLQLKIADYYTVLGIDAGTQTKIQTALNWLIWALQIYSPARKSDATAATAWRKSLFTGDPAVSGLEAEPPGPTSLNLPAGPEPFFGSLTWLFTEIARWKKAVGYEPAIGEALQIVGPMQPPPPPSSQPEIKLRLASGGLPEIVWTKGVFEGIRIQIDRGDGKGFVDLATDMKPNFIDDLSPLPAPGTAARWTYRAIYLLNDEVFGQWSDPASIAVQG